MPKKKSEWFVQRTLVDGVVTEATYWPNIASAVLHELHNYGRGDVTIESYCDAHGPSPEEPISLRKLDRMERDLLKLSTEELKKKYPNADISDTLKTSEQIKKEEEKSLEMYSLMS
jgi:hypothetical protein